MVTVAGAAGIRGRPLRAGDWAGKAAGAILGPGLSHYHPPPPEPGSPR